MSKVIVIAHQKGGVGKSTIAANIAVELSKLFNIKVIDLDFQRSLTYFNNKRIQQNLSPLDIIKVDSINELRNILNSDGGIYIIDTGGFDADMNRLAIAGADLLLTPVSDAEIEQVGLLSFREILRDIRQHRQDLKASILLNRIHQWANTSLNDVCEFIKDNPEFVQYPHILRDRADYKKAFSEGKSVIEYNNTAVIEMKLLVEEISKFLKEDNNG
jgi:chromosome partitioning protein